jgi:hypothetical protein
VSSQFLKSWPGPSKIRHIWDIWDIPTTARTYLTL